MEKMEVKIHLEFSALLLERERVIHRILREVVSRDSCIATSTQVHHDFYIDFP